MKIRLQETSPLSVITVKVSAEAASANHTKVVALLANHLHFALQWVTDRPVAILAMCRPFKSSSKLATTFAKLHHGPGWQLREFIGTPSRWTQERRTKLFTGQAKVVVPTAS